MNNVFYAIQGRIFCVELSRGTTIAAEIGQAVVDLKLEVNCDLKLYTNFSGDYFFLVENFKNLTKF